MQPTEAFIEGVKAYKEGKFLHENSYKSGTKEKEDFKRGWWMTHYWKKANPSPRGTGKHGA